MTAQIIVTHEVGTGRKGWRAYLEPDTAHLIHVLEESGIAEFTLIEDRAHGHFWRRGEDHLAAQIRGDGDD